MPVVYPRQQRGSESNTLSPARIVGIVIVIVIILSFTGLLIFRHHRRKQRESASSRRSRQIVKNAFPRPAPDPSLPPYEPRREDVEMQNGADISGSGAATPRMPPPARMHTPPGYGTHIADRPAGPLTDSPPAYHQHDRQTWGRSGCVR